MVSKVRNPFVLAVNAVLCLKFSWWPYNQCQQRLLTSAEKSSELQNKVDKIEMHHFGKGLRGNLTKNNKNINLVLIFIKKEL